MPNEDEIAATERIIRASLRMLVARDRDLFDIKLIDPPRISPDARLLNRELHETTINHRFATYIEQNIKDTKYEAYQVDIEYNRYYDNEKIVQTIEGQKAARPDIIVHSRIDSTFDPQHFLVIEAKKGKSTAHDKAKIRGFLTDPKYRYQFGLTISYCHHQTSIAGLLYYMKNGDLLTREVQVPRN